MSLDCPGFGSVGTSHCQTPEIVSWIISGLFYLGPSISPHSCQHAMPAAPYPRLSGFLSCVLIAEPAGEIRTKFIHIATASYSWFSEFICTLGSAWRLFCLSFLSFLSFSPKLGHFLQVPSSNCLPLTSSRWPCFLSPWEIKVFGGDISCLPPLTSKPSWLPSLLLALRKDCCYCFFLRLTSYTESFFASMVRT